MRASKQVVVAALNTAEPSSVTADSLYDKMHNSEEHVHSASKVYPTLAAGVTLTAGAAWTLGAFAEIVPASTITSEFDIHHISVEALSAVEVYEIVLYYGAGDTECARVRATKAAALEGTLNVPVQTVLIPANSRIRAKVATAGGGDTCDISIFYHTY